MFPYIDFGPVHLGTFGLLLWLAAVAATVVLHKNFVRNGVDADALSVVAFVVIAGVIGAKTWHELQNINDLKYALKTIGAPGWKHPLDVAMEFLHWFQAVCVVWWNAGWNCDVDVAGKPRSIQRRARRDAGQGGGSVSDAGSCRSCGRDWLWCGADRMFDFRRWRLRDQYDPAMGCAYGEKCLGAAYSAGCAGTADSCV